MADESLTIVFMPESAYGPTNNCVGIGKVLGLHGVHAIRALGMIVFAWWLGLLSSWMRERRISPLWFWLVLLAALLSPVVRWGAMVTRPEIWQGFLWMLMLMELAGSFRKSRRWTSWRLPVLLAAAAYIHFEAIVWLVPALVGLFPIASELGPMSMGRRLKEWGKRIIEYRADTTVAAIRKAMEK